MQGAAEGGEAEPAQRQLRETIERLEAALAALPEGCGLDAVRQPLLEQLEARRRQLSEAKPPGPAASVAGEASGAVGGRPRAGSVDSLDGDCAAGLVRKRRRVLSCAEEGAGSMLLMRGLALVAKLPIFAKIEASEYPVLVGAFTSSEHEPGEVLVQRGQPGREMLLIDGGKASVTVPGKDQEVEVQVLGSGDALGQDNLLSPDGRPWSATVLVVERLRAWRLETSEFERLGFRNRVALRRRLAEHQISVPSWKQRLEAAAARGLADESPKTDEEKGFLRKAVRANSVLGPLVCNLAEDALDRLVRRAQKQSFTRGSQFIKQGQTDVEFFYIIEQGTIAVLKNRELVQSLGPGGSFGERAIVYREPRMTTVKALSDATIWKVPGRDLKGIERSVWDIKVEKATARLSGLGCLKGASRPAVQQLADALVEVAYPRGERILCQGEACKAFYILYRGAVNVEIQKAAGLEVSRLVGVPEKDQAEMFGEDALSPDSSWRSPVSVIAASETVVMQVLDRDTYLRIVHPASTETGVFCGGCGTPLEPTARVCLTCETAPAYTFDSTFNLKEGEGVRNYSRQGLKEVGLLGCGRFARVSLVQCTDTGRPFALKSLCKSRIVEHKQEQNILVEKMILKTTRSPFLIRLFATFNTDQHLHFLLEAALGGDLLTALERHDIIGSATHARFYIACILKGLEHLHDRYIMYRDLKMENVMIDSRGYAKLTDFGLSKFVIGHTYTKCGTPDYMAPEMVLGAAHNSAVDWWSLGVILYALMEGSLPFDATDTSITFWKVQQGIEMCRFTNSESPLAELVRSLCKQQPRERLPVRAGARGILEHEWFAESKVDWSQLDCGALPAPWVPTISGPLDLQNFDSGAVDLHANLPPYQDPGSGWDLEFEDLVGPANID